MPNRRPWRRKSRRRRAGDEAPARRAPVSFLRLELPDRPGLERQLGQQLLELLLVRAPRPCCSFFSRSSATCRSSASRSSSSARSSGSAFAISADRDRGGARNCVAASLPSLPSSSVACSVRDVPALFVGRRDLRAWRSRTLRAPTRGRCDRGRRLVAAERLDEKLREPRLVALAAGPGRRDDRPRRARRAAAGTRRSSSRC